MYAVQRRCGLTSVPHNHVVCRISKCGVYIPQASFATRGTRRLNQSQLLPEGNVSSRQICGCERAMRDGSQNCSNAMSTVPSAVRQADQ